MSRPDYDEMLHHIVAVGGCYCECIKSARGVPSRVELPAVDNAGHVAEPCLICRCRTAVEAT